MSWLKSLLEAELDVQLHAADRGKVVALGVEDHVLEKLPRPFQRHRLPGAQLLEHFDVGVALVLGHLVLGFALRLQGHLVGAFGVLALLVLAQGIGQHGAQLLFLAFREKDLEFAVQLAQLLDLGGADALVELQHAVQVGGGVQVLEKLHVHRHVLDAELFKILDVLDHQLGAGGQHLVALRVQDRGRELVVL